MCLTKSVLYAWTSWSKSWQVCWIALLWSCFPAIAYGHSVSCCHCWWWASLHEIRVLVSNYRARSQVSGLIIIVRNVVISSTSVLFHIWSFAVRMAPSLTQAVHIKSRRTNYQVLRNPFLFIHVNGMTINLRVWLDPASLSRLYLRSCFLAIVYGRLFVLGSSSSS